MERRLEGARWVLERGMPGYPGAFDRLDDPPERLYGIGRADVLAEGLAVVGARKATPYGRGCARRFARRAARRGVVIISGGARGCDEEAHRAAVEAGAPSVVFLGGGCDRIYPRENAGLFQQVIEAGGAVVSEHPWEFAPLPYTFRARNRLIASLARAVLIVEAGLPSGTFSTADEALEAGREVLVVPGAITSANARGSNRLLFQGARPIVDDESFDDVLFDVFGLLKEPSAPDAPDGFAGTRTLRGDPVVEAIRAAPSTADELFAVAVDVYGRENARAELMSTLALAESAGAIARQPDGRWCARVPPGA
jgi:DNA processing protein